MKRNENHDGLCKALRAINYCDTQVINPNEYAIIRTNFMHVAEEGKSVQQLADESAISQASVSRFIRKLGYRSFEEFRYHFSRDFETLYMDRKAMHTAMFPDMNCLYEDVYQRAVSNLNATMQKIDRDVLKRVVTKMDNARSVSICGDDHTLSIFYTFQLDLMARGVPTFLFKNEEIQNMNASALQDGNVLLFLNVFSDFVHPEQLEILQQLRKKSDVYTVGLFQDDGLEDLFDAYVLYGNGGSMNDGFYSLWMLSQIMSELLYAV